MRLYSVYVLTNKANGKKYYGMTSQKPERRWGRNGNKYTTNRALREAINIYGWNGFSHEVLARGLPFLDALLLERASIKLDDTTNPDKGYNRVPGAYASREQSYKNISAAKMGHTVSATTREKIRLATRRLPVAQFTPSGDHVATHLSLTDAAKAVSAHKGHVCDVCCGRRRTLRGFVFRYADSQDAARGEEGHAQ